MKSICACALFLGFSTLAAARPVVIEETATLTNPDPTAFPQFGRMVATNGEYALVLGARDDLTDPSGEPMIRRLHLRSGGTVSLRKLVNGTITTLVSAPLAVSLNTQYALRLEVVGNQLRGYVNDNLLLQATDSSHAAGIGGLMTNKAAAQFDDYIAYQP